MALLLLGSWGGAFAQGPELTPSLTAQESYDDNPLQLQRGAYAGSPTSSLVHSLTPSVALFLPFHRSDLRLQYAADFFAYQNRDAVRAAGGVASGVYQNADGALSVYAVPDLLVFVKDHYAPIPVVPWQAAGSLQGVAALNVLTPGLLYDHPIGARTRWILGYQYEWGHYVAPDTPGLVDWGAHQERGAVSIALVRPLALGAEYTYRFQDFYLPHPYAPPVSDVTTQTLLATLSVHAGRPLSLDLKAGEEFLDYAEGGPSVRGTLVEGALNLQLGKRFVLSGGPHVLESFDPRGTRYHETGGGIRLDYKRDALLVSGGVSLIDYTDSSVQGPPIDTLAWDLGADYNLTRRVTGGVGVRAFRRWVSARGSVPPPSVASLSDDVYFAHLRVAF